MLTEIFAMQSSSDYKYLVSIMCVSIRPAKGGSLMFCQWEGCGGHDPASFSCCTKNRILPGHAAFSMIIQHVSRV